MRDIDRLLLKEIDDSYLEWRTDEAEIEELNGCTRCGNSPTFGVTGLCSTCYAQAYAEDVEVRRRLDGR